MQNDLLVEKKEISILIADDHKLLRETWNLFFDMHPGFAIVGQASDGNEAIQLSQELNPDIILMDINMGAVGGIEASEAILKNNPGSKIIAVSMNMNLAIVRRILKLGLYGYVTKYSSMEELTKAITNVHNGIKYICKEIKDLMADAYLQEEVSGPDQLTFREITILPLIKQGLSSREIAGNLGISLKTVEVHRYNILKKTKMKNTASLMTYCIQNGL